MKILRFNSAFTVSFHSSVKFDSGMTNHNSLLCIASNKIASFCIDNRLRQMDFFVFAEVDKGQLSSNWERFWNKKAVSSSLFLYCIKQIDSMLSCICSVNRSQRTSKCGKNISDTLGYSLVCHTLFFLPHFDTICNLFLNTRTATWNLFVKCDLSRPAWQLSQFSNMADR